MACAVGVQELRVDVELGVQVEAVQVEHLGDRHLAEVHLALRRARVHVLEAVRSARRPRPRPPGRSC